MDEQFNQAMLMTITTHLFYKDWGVFGVLGVMMLCIAWAIFMTVLEKKDA